MSSISSVPCMLTWTWQADQYIVYIYISYV